MSEHDIKVWTESRKQAYELTDEELVRRLHKTAYSHGWIGCKRGLDTDNAKRLQGRSNEARIELLKRLGET